MGAVPDWVMPLLRCSSCGSTTLRYSPEHLACESCHQTFSLSPVANLAGGEDFARVSQRTRDLDEMEEYCDQLRRKGWIGNEMIASTRPGSAILSVGEGYGELLILLAQRHPDRYFVGVDASPDRMAQATRLAERMALPNVWFAVADAMNLPFVDDAFEVGYARGILHVLPDHRPALLQLRRVLQRRLLVDRLANWPFFQVWMWLLQRYENIRALFQRRAPDPRIWQDVRDTLDGGGTFLPLAGYRRWFRDDRRARVVANWAFIWEGVRHRPVLGWLGTEGAVDVEL